MIAAGTTTAQNGGFNLTGGGCYAVNGVCVGGGATSSNPMGSIQLADGTGKFTSTSSFSFATATNILSLGTPHESIRLFSTTSGSSFTGNLFLGDSAGNIANNNSGILNTGIGRATMSSISSGIWNTALGAFSQQSNTTGNFNTSVGVSSLRFSTGGDSNSAFGLFALSSTVGSNNVGIGANSLSTNTSGNNSVGIGNHALSQLSQATNTVAVGFQAGMSTVGNSNQGGTFIGYQAGRAVNTGADYNTFVGYQAGFDTTTGAGNLVLGDWQSSGVGVTTGSNNILIGSGVRNGLNQTGSNQLNIGNLLFGTGLSTNATASTGRIGIGTSTPWRTLSVQGSLAVTGLTVSIGTPDAVCIDPVTKEITTNTGAANCTVSSQKYKHDISTLSYAGVSALEKIQALRPVSYKNNSNNDENIGFVAEEVKDVDARLVFFEPGSETDTRGVKYEHITALLAMGIQEQQVVIDSLKNMFWSASSTGEEVASTPFFAQILTAFAYITDFFTKRVTTEELCIGTLEDRTCLTKGQVDQLLDANAVDASTGGEENTNEEDGSGSGDGQSGEEETTSETLPTEGLGNNAPPLEETPSTDDSIPEESPQDEQTPEIEPSPEPVQ